MCVEILFMGGENWGELTCHGVNKHRDKSKDMVVTLGKRVVEDIFNKQLPKLIYWVIITVTQQSYV